MKNQFKQKVLLLCLFVFILWGYFFKHQNSSNLRDKGINIFVLAGQSNMAGRGGVENQVWDEIVPLECSSDKRILRMNENSEVEEAREPLHAGIDANKTCGVGPGMAFANALLKKGSSKFGSILLVPGAVGGTSIREWSGSDSRLRRELVKRTRDAVRFGGKIRAILWYQGEKDTESEEGAIMYRSEYQEFVRNLYCELENPQVPFIQVALASGQGERRWLESVRATQYGMENIITVDAMGLALHKDGLHLTTMSQVHLGNMLANAFLSSIYSSNPN